MATGRFTDGGKNFVVAIEGLDDIDFDTAPAKVRKLAARAVNWTARRYRTVSAREMRDQIAFPARYLTGAQAGRLRVSRFASEASLEAAITGRDRPTSLARFVKGARTPQRKSPTVEVGTGHRVKMNRAFLVSLRNANIGLAVRLREGERVENKKVMVRMSGNLYLLYGPSVDQVFRSVSEDVSEDAAADLENEFLRLVEALL